MTEPAVDDEPPGGRGLVRLSDILQQGAGTSALRRSLRSGDVVREFRGVYRVASTVPPALVRLRAAHAHLGPESVLVLGSAARAHGLAGVGLDRLPELALPPGLERAQRDGMRIHVWQLPDEQRCLVDGLPATTVTRTLADIARLLPRLQAVACIDSALHVGLVEPDELEDVARLMRRLPHCVSGRRRLAESRVGAQSPLETRVRLRAADGGFPPDALQVPVRDSAQRLIGYGDLGYRLRDGRWLIVEADGLAVHGLPEALLHDRRRQNAFLTAGVAGVLRFTWEDTRVATYIPQVLAPAMSRLGWTPPTRPP